MKRKSFLMLFGVFSLCLCACKTNSESNTENKKTTEKSTVERLSSDYTSLDNISSSDFSTDNVTSESTVVSETTAPITESISEINPLDEFKVISVAGIEVKEDKVTLTQSQYDALLLSPKDNCEYTVAEGVDIEITVNRTELVFDLTSMTGNKEKYVISLNVLSNLADIEVKTVFNKKVINDKVTLSESEYKAFLNSEDYNAACEYQSSDDSTVQITFDKKSHTLLFDVVSQDQTKTNRVKVEVDVALPFGTHSLTGAGDKKSAAYDYEKLEYTFNGSAAITNEKGENLSGSYAFSAQIHPETLSQGNEVVFSALYADNYQIRFALRGVDESYYLIFSDYKDRSNFLNYKEHIASTEYNKEKGVNMGVIVVDGNMVMTIDGKTVYRRALPQLTYTEMFLSTHECVARMKNLKIVSDEAKAKSMYQDALIDYKDRLTGVSLINTSENINEFVENVDGGVYVEGKNSNKRVMGALYQNGVPVGGYEYAVSGHMNITDTKTSGGAASKVELQIAKNVQNFVKIQLFRYPTNNSIYAYPTVNGKALSQVNCEKNTLPKGTEYQTDYIFVYSGQEIRVYFKDGSYLEQYKLVYSMEASWGYTMFIIAMRQYCNVTFDNFRTYYGDDYDALVNSLESCSDEVKFSSEKDTYIDNGCFNNGNKGTYYKSESSYDKAFVYQNNKAVNGDYWLASGKMQFGEYKAWTQGELSSYVDATHAIRYVFEYTGSYYQVFHEIKNGTDNWTGYTLIVRPQIKNDATMNFTLVNHGQKASLLINGLVYHTVELDFLKNGSAAIGGKGGTLILKNLAAETDKTAVEEFVKNMKDYTYVSPYENRISTLAKQYQSAEKGGVLIMGSSTMDYWKDWQSDIGGRLGYNVGIGGTIVEDWLYAYDRLVKPFEPSVILVYLGGNNINNMGHNGKYTRSLMENLLNKMHADFPKAKIHYIYSMAVPSCYKGGKFNYEYGQFILEMKNLVSATEWLNGIDTFEQLTKDGEAKKELYRDDGIHLNDDGYDVFAEIIDKAVFSK